MVVDSVKHYMTLSKAQMSGLNQIDCAEASLLINEAAIFVQSETNRYQAKAKWAEECITRLIASKVSHYGTKYTPFDYRRQMAIKDNEAAQALEKVRVNCQLCVDEMAFVPTQMRNIAASYAELSNSKRYKRETP